MSAHRHAHTHNECTQGCIHLTSCSRTQSALATRRWGLRTRAAEWRPWARARESHGRRGSAQSGRKLRSHDLGECRTGADLRRIYECTERVQIAMKEIAVEYDLYAYESLPLPSTLPLLAALFFPCVPRAGPNLRDRYGIIHARRNRKAPW